jgi:hypothetical protein
MDKWVKNGFEYRYEFSRDSGEMLVIRIDHLWDRPRYALVSKYRDGRGYWREQSLGQPFSTLRAAKGYAALICPETNQAVTA